ncbi:hypothetical protein JKJ11_05925 [Vibrio sp. SCSIO 43133]|uniref:hypothetical protein n=1 Tax=Vibrio sp. SCSIO 43133 TaxID=2802577 RepID=UPI002074E3F7|nr:hypothetical protein [Vibrio sp. SCSIO 43133]USE01590.1 hypothetical protein JKJ11_05925 [Vibrio sp. SCSIO 43133]
MLKENEQTYLVKTQLIEAVYCIASKMDWSAREIESATSGVERIVSKLFILGRDTHGGQLDLDLLTQTQAEDIVNAIVYSSCGETKTALSDLVLLSLLLSTFYKYISTKETSRDSLGNAFHDLSITDSHIDELWPWDRLFWPWK